MRKIDGRYESMPFGCRNSLVEEKRRLEARVAQLEEEMDEEHAEVEQLTERARKSAAQVRYIFNRFF